MELSFLTLPEKERQLYIEQAALRRNVSPLILEKDFTNMSSAPSHQMEGSVFRQFMGEL